jgi:uncharacterized repeat protein (TIGR02543 family)
LLITGVAIDKNSGTITIPSGFTLIQKGEGGIASGAMAYKIATGGETTISWSWTVNQEGSVWIGEYSGLVPTDVLDVSAENEAYLSTATNTISTGTTPSTTQANELAIVLFASDSNNSVGNTRTWTNGFITLKEITDITYSGGPFLNVASKTLTAIGTVESTLTHNGNDESYAMVATFKALPSGTPWHAEETKTISGTSTTTTFTVTLADGNYTWKCLEYDEAGNSAFATSDYDFTVDTSAPPIYYTLTTSIVGNGAITPTSGSTYLAGTIVDVNAIPNSGWQFITWGGDLSGSTNPTTITMDGDKTISATFTEIPPVYYTLTIYVVGSGTATPVSGGSYLAGTVVDLEAIPDSGYEFDGWSGDLSGTDNTTTITMDNHKSITATFIAQAPSTGWTAYNDCIYQSTGQYIGTHVTTFGIGSGFTGSTTGILLNQATGNPTSVTATLTQSGGVIWQPSTTSGGHDTASGTDAYNTFHNIADMTGVIYYGSVGWYVDLTFTGLDPAKQYTFATSAARSDSTYTDRISIYTLSGADTYTQASTSGVTINAPDQVQFCTGDNNNLGYVARWTGITATDGSFAVRAQATASQYKAYAFDVFMLQEEPS